MTNGFPLDDLCAHFCIHCARTGPSGGSERKNARDKAILGVIAALFVLRYILFAFEPSLCRPKELRRAAEGRRGEKGLNKRTEYICNLNFGPFCAFHFLLTETVNYNYQAREIAFDIQDDMSGESFHFCAPCTVLGAAMPHTFVSALGTGSLYPTVFLPIQFGDIRFNDIAVVGRRQQCSAGARARACVCQEDEERVNLDGTGKNTET